VVFAAVSNATDCSNEFPAAAKADEALVIPSEIWLTLIGKLFSLLLL
jgi:hypothetical protein